MAFPALSYVICVRNTELMPAISFSPPVKVVVESQDLLPDKRFLQKPWPIWAVESAS